MDSAFTLIGLGQILGVPRVTTIYFDREPAESIMVAGEQFIPAFFTIQEY
jgi:hypothetical protein